MALIPQDNVLRNQLISAQTRLVNAQGMKIASSGAAALGGAIRQMTPEGKRVTKLDQILLNGNNIALLVPGGMPDEEE